jgi:hypothetical protein
MPSAREASGTQSQIESALDAGINALSQKQKVVFQRYQRFPLASDGSVFWVATGALLTAIGSLHYATDRQQSEDETLAQSTMIFTSESEVTQLSAASPMSMWIGTWPLDEAPPLRVAFSQRGNYYREADLHHYQGHAVYAAMLSQLIQSAADLPAGPIVSNSLPIWLAQTTFAGQSVNCFPSFLVPDNLDPPYIVAHVAPELTQALGAFPIIGPWPGSIIPNTGAAPLHALASTQLCRDEVTLTLYGFDNQAALQYLCMLIDASISGAAPFGFANSPVISDAKRPQVEIAALAQKKQIVISANYNQAAADAEARRLILSALPPDISIIGGIAVSGVGNTTQAEQTVTAEGWVYE